MNSSSTPTCEEIELLLPAAAAGALDPDESRLVQAHLLDCARCLPLLAEYEQVIEQLAYAVPQREPSPQVFDRLMAAIQTAPVAAVVDAPPVRAPLPANGAAARPAPAPRRSLAEA